MPQQHKVKISPNFLAQPPAAEPNVTSTVRRYDVINLPDVQTLGQSYLNQRYAPKMVIPLPSEKQEGDRFTIDSQAPTPESNLTAVEGGYDGKVDVLARTTPAESMSASTKDQDDAYATSLALPLTPGPNM